MLQNAHRDTDPLKRPVSQHALQKRPEPFSFNGSLYEFTYVGILLLNDDIYFGFCELDLSHGPPDLA